MRIPGPSICVPVEETINQVMPLCPILVSFENMLPYNWHWHLVVYAEHNSNEVYLYI